MKTTKSGTCFFCGGSDEIEMSPISWVSEKTGNDITILKPVCGKCQKIEKFSTDWKYYRRYFKRHSEFVRLDGGSTCGGCDQRTGLICIYSMTQNSRSRRSWNKRKLVIIFCNECQPHRAVMKIERMKKENKSAQRIG